VANIHPPEDPRGLALLNFYFLAELSDPFLLCHWSNQSCSSWNCNFSSTSISPPLIFLNTPHPTKKPNESKKTYSYPNLSFLRAARPVRAAWQGSNQSCSSCWCSAIQKISSSPFFLGTPFLLHFLLVLRSCWCLGAAIFPQSIVPHP
jgi:hypothetical protein